MSDLDAVAAAARQATYWFEQCEELKGTLEGVKVEARDWAKAHNELEKRLDNQSEGAAAYVKLANAVAEALGVKGGHTEDLFLHAIQVLKDAVKEWKETACVAGSTAPQWKAAHDKWMEGLVETAKSIGANNCPENIAEHVKSVLGRLKYVESTLYPKDGESLDIQLREQGGKLTRTKMDLEELRSEFQAAKKKLDCYERLGHDEDTADMDFVHIRNQLRDAGLDPDDMIGRLNAIPGWREETKTDPVVETMLDAVAVDFKDLPPPRAAGGPPIWCSLGERCGLSCKCEPATLASAHDLFRGIGGGFSEPNYRRHGVYVLSELHKAYARIEEVADTGNREVERIRKNFCRLTEEVEGWKKAVADLTGEKYAAEHALEEAQKGGPTVWPVDPEVLRGVINDELAEAKVEWRMDHTNVDAILKHLDTAHEFCIFEDCDQAPSPYCLAHAHDEHAVAEGKNLAHVDLSHIEARAVASLLENSGCNDPHTARASSMFGVPPDEVTPEQRQKGKAANFLQLYGTTTGRWDATRPQTSAKPQGVPSVEDRAREMAGTYHLHTADIPPWEDLDVETKRAWLAVAEKAAPDPSLSKMDPLVQATNGDPGPISRLVELLGVSPRSSLNAILKTAYDHLKLAPVAVRSEPEPAVSPDYALSEAYDLPAIPPSRVPLRISLKTWTEYFGAIVDGSKTFEVRENDRNFVVGDTLVLEEWNRDTKRYTGLYAVQEITYVMDLGQWLGDADVNQVVLGLKNVIRPQTTDEEVFAKIETWLSGDDPQDPSKHVGLRLMDVAEAYQKIAWDFAKLFPGDFEELEDTGEGFSPEEWWETIGHCLDTAEKAITPALEAEPSESEAKTVTHLQRKVVELERRNSRRGDQIQIYRRELGLDVIRGHLAEAIRARLKDLPHGELRQQLLDLEKERNFLKAATERMTAERADLEDILERTELCMADAVDEHLKIRGRFADYRKRTLIRMQRTTEKAAELHTVVEEQAGDVIEEAPQRQTIGVDVEGEVRRLRAERDAESESSDIPSPWLREEP